MIDDNSVTESTVIKYALVFGGTGAIGGACSLLLAQEGFGILSVYRESRGALKGKQKALDLIDGCAMDFKKLNINASDQSNENRILTFIEHSLMSNSKNARIALVLDAIADANVNKLFDENERSMNTLAVEDISRTISAMGTATYRWARLLKKRNLLSDDCRIIGLTSVGVEKCLNGYAATASAKSVMETLSRYMAVELKGSRMTSNIIRSGIIPTEAFLKLPSADLIATKALEQHPKGRLTRPEDIANVVSLLMRPEADWINGTIIDVDGGEHLMG
jgi:enoyl-[acyl-carrier protein] reductase III